MTWMQWLVDRVPALKAFGPGMNQEKRREALKSKVLVFVSPGYEVKRPIYERAHALGVRSVIIDTPSSWSQTLLTEGLVEKWIGIDAEDFDECFKHINFVKEELGQLDGVLSFCEVVQPLIAKLTEALNLPGNSVKSVDVARDKRQTRVALEAAGLPNPRSTLIKSSADLGGAAEHVGFPAVIKPIFGAASIGVIRVNDEDELKTNYATVLAQLRAVKIVGGCLVEGDADDEHAEDVDTDILMEEYLDGYEVDVDCVFAEGKCNYSSLTDNWPTFEPWFNETGSNAPSIYPKAQQDELMDLCIKAVECMGFTMGVFHVEAKYTSRGARLIEVNCRMGGGLIQMINEVVWGVDLVEEQLMLSAGVPPAPYRGTPKPLCQIAESRVNAPRSGYITNETFMDQYQSIPRVLRARPLVKAGKKVVAPQDGLPTWVAEIMVQCDDLHEGIEYVKGLEQQASYPISDRNPFGPTSPMKSTPSEGLQVQMQTKFGVSPSSRSYQALSPAEKEQGLSALTPVGSGVE